MIVDIPKDLCYDNMICSSRFCHYEEFAAIKNPNIGQYIKK